MRAYLAGVAVVGLLELVSGGVAVEGAPGPQSRATGGDCVTIGTPKPSVTYVYLHSEPRGKVTEVTTTWESVTSVGSRSRTTGSQGVIVQVNEHHIADDVAVLDKSAKFDAKGSAIDTTTFRPGIVSDPAFRACTGRSWPIPSVTASYQSAQVNASSPTPAGTG
jgi:hypothetical protein